MYFLEISLKICAIHCLLVQFIWHEFYTLVIDSPRVKSPFSMYMECPKLPNQVVILKNIKYLNNTISPVYIAHYTVLKFHLIARINFSCFSLLAENDGRWKYLATAKKANSTFRPVLAEVSIKGTLYSCANRSPSSLFTTRSVPQSDLLPKNINFNLLGASVYSEQTSLINWDVCLNTNVLMEWN